MQFVVRAVKDVKNQKEHQNAKWNKCFYYYFKDLRYPQYLNILPRYKWSKQYMFLPPAIKRPRPADQKHKNNCVVLESLSDWTNTEQ